MADELKGKTIAILAAEGVEQSELEQPRDAVAQAGAANPGDLPAFCARIVQEFAAA